MTRLSSQRIKAEAARLGFNACGIAPAEPIDARNAARLSQFAELGEEGEMAYMARNGDVRRDPRLLLPGAATIVSVALSYYPDHRLPADQPQLSFYAYGNDYHVVVKQLLQRLLEATRQMFVEAGGSGEAFAGRAFCDTAPIAERYWAWRSGIGWIGNNTQLIVPGHGSYFFLGELVVTPPADAYDEPISSRCGTCTRCIDACPMHAIVAPRHIDARRCLSYLTIEQRGPLSAEAAAGMGSCIYGCDRCQKACPHNQHPLPTKVEEFRPSPDLQQMTAASWLNLTEEQWRTLFRHSAVKRAKFSGLKRNVQAALGDKRTDSGETADTPPANKQP